MGTTHQKYGVHPGVLMVQKWLAELPAKTGRSLDQWIALARKEAPGDEAALRNWFRDRGHGSNSAAWLAARAAGKPSEEDSPERYLAQAVKYVDAMYAGPKAGLRPLHDALIELGLSLGTDVKFCPCSTIVPLYRHHVIAQVKPATRTRIDFGLALGDTKGSGRLKETGGFAKKDRITHKIEITAPAEIDATVRKWLEKAYRRDAE